MRIAIVAAGGVGAYFGARLANVGHDVHFVARGAHLEAMQRDGLRVASIHGDVHLQHPNVTDDPCRHDRDAHCLYPMRFLPLCARMRIRSGRRCVPGQGGIG